jgi:hypothetical protein
VTQPNMPSPSDPTPGFYPDSQGVLRLWDGQRWTEVTRPMPQSATPPPGQPGYYPDARRDAVVDGPGLGRAHPTTSHKPATAERTSSQLVSTEHRLEARHSPRDNCACIMRRPRCRRHCPGHPTNDTGGY